MEKSLRIGIVGIGVMGGAIARHLGNAGHQLAIYNRTFLRMTRWQKANPGISSEIVDSAADAAKEADVVITCVGNDDDLADVVLGPRGAFETLRPGGIFIDHTTVSARLSRQIAVEARDREIHCVDAPVTGSQSGAEDGTLTVMCGGRASAIAAATPILEHYAARIVHVGKAGSGQTTKMVNQLCIAGIIASLAEAVRFAEASHLDLEKVYDAICGGAAQSWQMVNRWPTMVSEEFDFGFAIDWMRKDLGLAIEEGRGIGVSLPVAALVDQFFADVQAMGYGKQDTSALIRRLPRQVRR